MDSGTAATPSEDLTYAHPNIKDWTLDQNLPERTRFSSSVQDNIRPSFGLGLFDRLPLEILQEILVILDLRSLTSFTHLNRMGVQIAKSVPQYAAILRNSPTSLYSILEIGLGSQVTCHQLFRALSTQKCQSCNDYGGFIYTLTCSRVCFLCFTEKAEYLPLMISEAAQRFGVDRKRIAHLPHMKSLPGCYSPNERHCSGRKVLVDPGLARGSGVAVHGSLTSMEHFVAEAEAERWETYHRRIDQKAAGSRVGTPHRPPTAQRWDGESSNPRRFMAVMRAPWLNESTKKSDWGFHCLGCQRGYRARPCHWRRKYSAETFDEHIRECGDISDGQHTHLAFTSG